MGVPDKVEVEWHDSEGHGSWRPIAEARADAERPLVHRSCGYLLAETEEALALSQSYRDPDAHGEELVADTLRIPRAVVVGVSKLRRR